MTENIVDRVYRVLKAGKSHDATIARVVRDLDEANVRSWPVAARMRLQAAVRVAVMPERKGKS